jgi:hypothetical protein
MSENVNEVEQTTGFNIASMFEQEATTSELQAGVHERIRLVSVDPNRREDREGNLVKKQLFLKFKKFGKTGEDIGEINVSFFMIDPAKDSAINNLHLFLSQTRELLSVYLPEEQLNTEFDPLAVLVEEDNKLSDDELAKNFSYDLIKKKVLRKASQFTLVEETICKQFSDLIADKVGFESDYIRLRLEMSKEGNYVQIPRFDRFIEKAAIKKEDSVLYANAK